MSKGVQLKDVTASNWRAVVRLELEESQKELLASNLYSIAESKFDPSARPRAIYAEKRLVGFLMYDVPDADDDDRVATIYRFMIDRKHQGKGFGRAALAQAISEIKAIAGIKKISICYAPENPVAQQFYGSFGFVEIGRDEDHEVVAELAL
jgi:diamine N-acetyltransferase